MTRHFFFIFFFFNDTATTEIYTLSLHDALPICARCVTPSSAPIVRPPGRRPVILAAPRILLEVDRKSTRLNSSHVRISYAVFCLKKKNTKLTSTRNFSNFVACSTCGLKHYLHGI